VHLIHDQGNTSISTIGEVTSDPLFGQWQHFRWVGRFTGRPSSSTTTNASAGDMLFAGFA
jgi:hypothetical protein